MLLVPYRLNATYTRSHIPNLVIIALTTVFYFASRSTLLDRETVHAMVLTDWSLSGMLGSIFLHGGILHLVGNMLFLYVFGNAVCSALGSIAYPFAYLALGLCSSCAHLAFGHGAAVGASGAINGIVALSLVLFPTNKLDCYYIILWFIHGRISLRCYWMILAWFVFDIVGAILGGGHTAYWAHIGGFAGGLILGFALLAFKWLNTFDPTLLEIIRGEYTTDAPGYSPDNESPGIESIPVGAGTALLASEQREFLQTIEKQRREAEDLHRMWNDMGDPAAAAEVQPPVLPLPTPKHETAPVVVHNPSPALRETPALMKLRVLKAERKNGKLTCYFVNDGDEVHCVSVVAPDLMTATMHPEHTFRKREPGWILIQCNGEALPHGVRVEVSYDDGCGARGSQILAFE